ncbi:MAG: TonB-dependent receptor [Vicinamibacteria bacterium]|jgi:outer membrane receptor protein involved in Fe transport|nr:TonB-dependent receptor [Vicinamibacteria bacterium]
MTRPLIVWMGLGLFGAAWTQAQTSPAPKGTPDNKDLLRREAIVVVTASKTEQSLADVPATMSVLTSETIAASTAQNCGDLMRMVPGINVVQLSARDVNLSSRQASGPLPNSQLALLDGRSIYLDFFGVILWDYVPSDLSEIKQIEAVSGPVSAIWGANAATGVINIVTKSPRESAGTSVSLSGGLFSRHAGDSLNLDPGGQWGAYARIARAPNPRWSYKISASLYHSDPFARPAGTVPMDRHPLLEDIAIGGGQFAAMQFKNTGTRQPKLDARVDRELAGGARLALSSGIAGTSGIIHTGIGPFDMQRGSYMAYQRAAYSRGNLRLAAFVNWVDTRAPSLMLLDAATGTPIQLDFKTRTFDIEAGHSRLLGQHHLLTYGGNARRNVFDITIAPKGRDRSEIGAYVQDEIYTTRFRLSIGGRVDKFGNLSDPVFSPRLAALYKLTEAHTVRASFNQAFRAPSLLNNYLDLTIQALDGLWPICASAPMLCANPALLPRAVPLGPRAIGSEIAREINPALPTLKEEGLTAYELAYDGSFNKRTSVRVAAYINITNNNVNFVADPETLTNAGLPAFYSSQYPPPGWPFPASLLDMPAFRAALFDRIPATNAYLNLGRFRNRGIELTLQHALRAGFTANLNYSWQETPKALTADPGQLPFPTAELSLPPSHRLNASVQMDRGRLLGSLSVHYVSRTFWNDVMPTMGFEGYTDAYALANASIGLRFPRQHLTVSLKGTNLLNQEIRQHLFGDILKRGLMAEARCAF